MATAEAEVQAPEKKSKLPLIIGLVMLLAGGGGGFYAAYSGLLDSVLGGGNESSAEGHGAPADNGHGAPAADAHGAPAAEGHGEAAADGHGEGGAAGGTNFVPMQPIIVSLGQRGNSQHLRFSAQLEVAPGQAANVTNLMPRITDVINIYLRALDPPELEEPSALLRLRGQMLRRIQIVTGPGMVNDLLIMEFVFN